VSSPPLELWPEVIARTEMPEDVRKELILLIGNGPQ
jgi:hypothetical protein